MGAVHYTVSTNTIHPILLLEFDVKPSLVFSRTVILHSSQEGSLDAALGLALAK